MPTFYKIIAVNEPDLVCDNIEVELRYENVAGRDLVIYLPPNYWQAKGEMPVIYMFDGQNLGETFAYGTGWNMPKVMQDLYQQEGLSFVAVGIFNGEQDRCTEYSPYVDLGHGIDIPEPGAEQHSSLIIEEIIPFIDDNLRENGLEPGPRFLMGSSMGGLMSFWMAMKYSEIFQGAAAMSPSFWIGEQAT
ncbi:MAG: alpha/beta hydrolase-fold protein, partial [Candidatus Margulisiibacteriota bacterium]